MSWKYYDPPTLTIKYKNNSQNFSAISESRVYSTHKSLHLHKKFLSSVHFIYTFCLRTIGKTVYGSHWWGFLYEGLGLQTTFRNRSTIQSPVGS